VTKDELFNQNLLRLLCAESFFLASLNAAREMYGKSYFALGAVEKQALDQMVLNSIGGNYQSLTPDWFGAPTQGPTGFQPPGNPPTSS
jgi:hypothetical protein